jgi:hypothetical protein
MISGGEVTKFFMVINIKTAKHREIAFKTQWQLRGTYGASCF